MLYNLILDDNQSKRTIMTSINYWPIMNENEKKKLQDRQNYRCPSGEIPSDNPNNTPAEWPVFPCVNGTNAKYVGVNGPEPGLKSAYTPDSSDDIHQKKNFDDVEKSAKIETFLWILLGLVLFAVFLAIVDGGVSAFLYFKSKKSNENATVEEMNSLLV